MGAIIGILGRVIEVGKCICGPISGPIKRHLKYLYCFSNNIQSLRDEAQKLKDKTHDLEMRVDAAKNNAQVIYRQVESWLENARKSIDEINGIENDVPEVQRRHLNLISRYSLSKKAEKATEDLRKLCNDCQFERIAERAPPTAMRRFRRGPKEEFETRKKIEEDVMEALRDTNVNKIGLRGMGGIGKTTMADRIMDRVKEEKLFDGALKVVVSQEVELHKIQQSIADQLGLTLNAKELEGRADEIHTRLTNTKSTLVVLDDVWETLKPEDLGIPCMNTFDKCKVLFTSRDRHVLEEMETQKIFSIQVLSTSEAWSLFTKRTGNCANREDLRSVAEDVAKECNGLPLALVAVGGALKNKERRELWEDALLQLRSATPIELRGGVLENVYKPLKVSYDFLGNQQAKSLFLLCSMFEEDFNIGLEMLTWYGMGLNLFEGLLNLTKARKRTCTLIELLKDRSLLLDGSDEDYVKMHDVVRDVAIYTACEEKRGGFVIDFDQRSWENCPEDCFWISVTNLSNRTEFPVEFKFPSARLLLMQSRMWQPDSEDLQSYSKKLTLPDNFFDGMQEIRVLSMDINIRSLPPTTQLLKNLKILRLLYCTSLESISVVGELLKLEILSCIGCHNIEALPTEIGRLNRLRLLEIIRCENLKRIVCGIISNLTSLEELRINDSFSGWEAEESANIEENAALVELERLTELTCLEIEINNVSLVAEEICLPPGIVKYDIAIMKEGALNCCREYRSERDYRGGRVNYCREMYLEIPAHGMNVGNWIKRLLRTTELLYLIGDGASQLVNLVEPEKIKDLTLESCSVVKTLVNTTSVFPLLEFLRLKCLGNLGEIMDSHNLHVAFPNLKDLTLEELPSLLTAPETLDKIVSPDNLRELQLKEVKDDAISSIWCVFSSFRNLERVDIEGLNGIKNLMSFSIARNLVQLKLLCVDGCKMMLDVIASDDEEEEVQVMDPISLFPHLEELHLSWLPNLRSFCQWNHHNITLELRSLEYLEIKECPEMETFAQQSVSTPKLRMVDFEESFVEIKDLNEAIQKHFEWWKQTGEEEKEEEEEEEEEEEKEGE